MKTKCIPYFVILLTLSACSHRVGSESVDNFGTYMELEKGKTVKSDLYNKFGQPHDVLYFGEKPSKSDWVYYSTKYSMNPATFIPFVGILAGGSDFENSISTFHFDESGVYRSFERLVKSKYVNQWAGLAAIAGNIDKKDERVKSEMTALNLPFSQETADKMRHIETTVE